MMTKDTFLFFIFISNRENNFSNMFDILVDLLARKSLQSLEKKKVHIYAWLLRHTHRSYLYFRSDIHIYASSTLW